MEKIEKITIHRALSELKLIGARIDKATEEFSPTGIFQKGKLVAGVYQKEDFEKSTTAKFQSVVDLLDRKRKIKSAIVKANAETKVRVADVEMTIADAISAKMDIIFSKNLIASMRKKNSSVRAALEKNNTQIDANALELARVVLGKDGIKMGDDDVKKVIEPFLEINTFHLCDPISVDQKIEDMEKKISSFEAEVDATLSEINAVTVIEI